MLKPAGGTWHPGYAGPFEVLGLLPPGPELALNHPVTGQSPGWVPVTSQSGCSLNTRLVLQEFR